MILLHQFNANKESWKTVIPELEKLNFNIVAIDLRGHGESIKEKKLFSFDEKDFQHMEWDVKAVKAHFHLSHFFLIGSSIGANTALNYAAKNRDVKGIVLLSPGTEYKGISISKSPEKLGKNQHLLIYTSKDDSYSHESSKVIFDKFSSPNKKLEVLDRAGHGVFMLIAKPNLNKEIAEWLNTRK